MCYIFLSGADIFLNNLNIRITTTIDKLNTIFQAEWVGIIKAAQAVSKRCERLKIVSDNTFHHHSYFKPGKQDDLCPHQVIS